jgi:hypothetical protein
VQRQKKDSSRLGGGLEVEYKQRTLRKRMASMDRCPRTRYLAMLVVLVGLTDCGGSLSAVGTAQSNAASRHVKIARSWMSPASRRSSLLYVSDGSSNVYVYSYPNGHLVGTLTNLDEPQGECVDGSGDVWITEYSSNQIVEYAHGGTNSIATLSGPDYPLGCSVDPASGNLAVAGNDLAVYESAKGYPTTYSNSDFPYFSYCTYDSAGDLFADSNSDTYGEIAELPKDGSELKTVSLNEDLITLSMQWDGSYVSIVGSLHSPSRFGGDLRNAHGQPHGPLQVYRVSVSGSSGTVVGEVQLRNLADKHAALADQFWISGNTIVGPDNYRDARQNYVLSWRYPHGGLPTHVIRTKWSEPWGTALSHAP